MATSETEPWRAPDPDAAPEPPTSGPPAPAPVPYPPPPPRSNYNWKALASFVVVLHALCVPPAGIVGAILGHVALKEIAESGQQGRGMAKTGAIVGWISAALGIPLYGLYFWLLFRDLG